MDMDILLLAFGADKLHHGNDLQLPNYLLYCAIVHSCNELSESLKSEFLSTGNDIAVLTIHITCMYHLCMGCFVCFLNNLMYYNRFSQRG